jgi:hypothetical protein
MQPGRPECRREQGQTGPGGARRAPAGVGTMFTAAVSRKLRGAPGSPAAAFPYRVTELRGVRALLEGKDRHYVSRESAKGSRIARVCSGPQGVGGMEANRARARERRPVVARGERQKIG